MRLESEVKNSAITLINSLPENVTWDDIMYEIYVKQKIEKGIYDSKNKNIVSHETVKKIFAVK